MGKSDLSQGGFTLIEALIAIAVLSIGILVLSTMQTTAIQGNATANRISASTDWASDQAEQIFAWNFGDSRLVDTNTSNGLDEVVNPDHSLPDNDDSVPYKNGRLSVVWNVEDGPVAEPDPDMTKMIRVIVYNQDQGSSKRVSFDYIKMKYMK